MRFRDRDRDRDIDGDREREKTELSTQCETLKLFNGCRRNAQSDAWREKKSSKDF